MNCAGRAGNALVHQRAAEVVGARCKAGYDAIPAHFHPGGLNAFLQPGGEQGGRLRALTLLRGMLVRGGLILADELASPWEQTAAEQTR